MNKQPTNPNEAAFAGPGGRTEHYACSPSFGLTKREYFAVMALQGLLAGLGNQAITNSVAEGSARESVQCANALIKELNKEVEP